MIIKIGGDGMKSRILVVEDDIFLREGLCELLTKEDYEPIPACNCAECRKTFENNTFDLVILDVMLPKMSGFEIVKKLRNQKIKTPVLTFLIGKTGVLSVLARMD